MTIRRLQVCLSLLASSLALPAGAQESTTYMGIDLEAPPVAPHTAPTEREVGSDLKSLLDEGVALGCLEFTPPTTFAQSDSTSDACSDYIQRLRTASAPEASAAEADLPPEPASPMARLPLVSVARMAYQDNKRAQLELGMRFEEGRGGVDKDWQKARELYEAAARATPARKGFRRAGGDENGQGSSLVITPVSGRVPGLKEARDRLQALKRKTEQTDE